MYLSITDFLPTLKKLFGNPVFLVYVFLTILQYNSLVGLITYETKFMEQQFNVSVARAIFLVGRYLPLLLNSNIKNEVFLAILYPF